MTLQAVLTAVTAARVSRRVAVIGGGSGGVVTARFLKRAGHSPTLFEAGSTFGGVWADDPTNDVVYQGLQTNLPTVVMQSPDLDFEPGVPSYIDKRALGRCALLLELDPSTRRTTLLCSAPPNLCAPHAGTKPGP